MQKTKKRRTMILNADGQKKIVYDELKKERNQKKDRGLSDQLMVSSMAFKINIY